MQQLTPKATNASQATSDSSESVAQKSDGREGLPSGKGAIKSFAIINTRTVVGVDALPVKVEVHLANGLPAFSTVGLPETTVKESKDRVRGAILNSGFEFPAKRITVNLAPADLPKTGGRFDLPIAIGILVASGQIQVDSLNDYEMVGELALDGTLRSVSGVLPTSLASAASNRELILPSGNAGEASLVNGAVNLKADHLLSVCRHLHGQEKILPCVNDLSFSNDFDNDCDVSDVKGQPYAVRAMEIAASGGHSLIFMGPPGVGKSMLASRLPGILPDLSIDSALEVAAIQSVSQGKFDIQTWRKRPFRSPHHSASAVALVGGGTHPKPGEITLAHKGVLFLDELTEFSRAALEQLREPIETGVVNIARANQSIQYPCQFMLVTACNPCKCGYFGDGSDRCRCSQASIEGYRNKLSGPMLDRIDMHIQLARVSIRELQASSAHEERSVNVRQRVTDVRALQFNRQGKLNSQYSGNDIQLYCGLDQADLAFLESACEKLNMSARAYHRIVRIARTIADMGNRKEILRADLAEALRLRGLDRRG